MLDLLTIILVDDPTPEDNDVVAGPLGFAVWIFLILAVVVIGFSLTRQLRRAQAAKDAGVYGDEPVDRSTTDAPETSTPETSTPESFTPDTSTPESSASESSTPD